MDRRKASKARGRAPEARAQQKRRKRRRRGKRTLHYLLLLIFVLAVGAVMSLTVFFKVAKVTVIGTDKYNPDAIVEATGIVVGTDNLLRIPTRDIEKMLLENYPYIESVRVLRRFPPAIEIQITQSKADFAVMEEGEVALVTGSGKILERGDILPPVELPLVKGIALGDYQPGEILGAVREGEDEQDEAGQDTRRQIQDRLVMLQYLLEASKKIGFGPITNVDLTDYLNMKMIYEARLVILLGTEADLEYKLTFLETVIESEGKDVQAQIDASNAREQRILVKYGTVANGEFYPLGGSSYDQLYTQMEDPELAASEEPEGIVSP